MIVMDQERSGIGRSMGRDYGRSMGRDYGIAIGRIMGRDILNWKFNWGERLFVN